MKKIILSAAIALFAVSAFAQSNNGKNKERKQKDQTTERVAKDRTDDDEFDRDRYDINNDGIFSDEERAARKADKVARKESRRMDRDDDGLLNGSAGKDNHGRDVSGTAKGTDFQGREKGEAVSDVARSNGRSRERVQGTGNTNRQPSTGRPAGTGKPTGGGRKNK